MLWKALEPGPKEELEGFLGQLQSAADGGLTSAQCQLGEARVIKSCSKPDRLEFCSNFVRMSAIRFKVDAFVGSLGALAARRRTWVYLWVQLYCNKVDP